MSNAPPNWVFSMFSFAGFLMCMVPLPWHLQAMNTGTVMYMLWNGLACLNYFINSVMFNGNVVNAAPVWCDISTRFNIGQTVAVPIAALCINRRLYLISSSHTVMTTRAERRRAVYVDLAICLGVPILQMILQYIVSGHRFDIYEDIGCYPYTWNTPAAFPLVTIWPVVIGLISTVYCVLSIRAFLARRAQFKELLSGHNLNTHRYFRLMSIAALNILSVTPLALFFVVFNATAHQVSPWVSWADTHFNYSKVVLYPAVLWRSVPGVEASLEMGRWLVVLEAMVFFGLFGFAEEARKNYRLALSTLSRRTGLLTSTFSGKESASAWAGSKTSGGNIMPVFVTRERDVHSDSHVRAKRPDSDTFTNMSGASYAFGDEEKAYDADAREITLHDVGGTLNTKEHNAEPPSPSSSYEEMDVTAVPRRI